MDTAIIITGFIALAAGLVLGAMFWGGQTDIVEAQEEEIAELHMRCLEFRGLMEMAEEKAHDAIQETNAAETALDAEKAAHRRTEYRRRRAKAEITKLKHMIDESNDLHSDDVQWIVNDLAELGVLINGRAFFLYKGRSLTYGKGDYGGRKIMYRPVFKREFGECCHPVNYSDPTKIGTVDISDSDDWKPLPDNQTTQGGSMSKDRAQALMAEIAKHYQMGIHTWGHCQACSQPARGGGLCAACLTDDLGQIVGQGPADTYLASVVELARARRVVVELASLA